MDDPIDLDHPWYETLPRLLSDIGVGLVIGDGDRALHVNDAFCSLTGYSVEEVLAQRPLIDLIAPEARQFVGDRVRRRLSRGDEPTMYETDLVHKDGHRVPVEVNARPVLIDGRTEIVGMFRDVTSSRRVAAELAIRAHQQAAVAELGRRALTDNDVSAVMIAAVEAVARVLDLEFVAILELLPGGRSLVLRAGVGWPEGSVGHATLAADPDSPAGRALATVAPVVVEDFSSEGCFRLPRFLSQPKVTSGATVVIRGEDPAYGVLGVEATEGRTFRPDDVHFLRAVANVVADALARGRIEAELATRVRQQAAVAELGRRALGAVELSALMDGAAEIVAHTLGIEYTKILQLLPGGDAFILRAGFGWKPGHVGRTTVGLGVDSQAGYTLVSDFPVVVEDQSQEIRLKVSPLLAEHGVVSGVSAIIIGPEGPWGVLGAHATRPRRFSTDDTHFLQAVANVLAESVRRASAEGALQRTFERETQLRRRFEAHSRLVVDAQEAERRSIARELHDEVGQALTGLRLMLENLERLPAQDVRDRLGPAQALATEVSQQVHNLALDLRPAILDDLGLRPALLWLFGRYTTQTGIEVLFRNDGLEDRPRPEVETAAYRIVQEALTNVARHAGGRQATVSCLVTEDFLEIEIADEGRGFVVDGVDGTQSSGLAGMEERARSTGGDLRLLSQPGQGTRVVAELRLAKPPPPAQ